MKCGQVPSGIHLAEMARTVLFGSEESTVSSASSLQQLRVSRHPPGLPRATCPRRSENLGGGVSQENSGIALGVYVLQD